jgi:hypothetical protein
LPVAEETSMLVPHPKSTRRMDSTSRKKDRCECML